MKINLVVMFGGKSVEHEISIISAMQAIENLDNDKYNIIPVYITKDGNMYSEKDFMSVDKFINFNEGLYKKIDFIKSNNKVYIMKKISFFQTQKTNVDVVLPIVHGTNVEDGKLQGFLETLNVPYCGPSVLSAAVGQDKAVSKDVLSAAGVSQTRYIWVLESDNDDDIQSNVNSKLTYPVILKPANLGSSIGISIVNNQDELINKVRESFNYDYKVIIEEVLSDFTEYNISFLGTINKYQISEIEKVIKDEDFLSFEDKYISGSKSSKSKIPSKGMASLSREIPAQIDDALKQSIIDNAKKAYRAINAQSVVRFDILVDSNNNAYINEVNNVPGSLAYYFWQASGMSYSELLDSIIQIAVDEFFRKKQKTNSFDSNVLAGYKKADNES